MPNDKSRITKVNQSPGAKPVGEAPPSQYFRFGIGHSDLIRIWGFGILISILAGCSSPNPANIQLRKQNQALREQITMLNRRHDGDVATIDSLQRDHGSIPTLPQERLARLFTTDGLQLGHMTGGYRNENSTSPSDGFEVEVVPIDQQGDAIKAAGSFTIEAFDLDLPQHPLIGTWQFPLEAARQKFFDHLMLYTYVLECPWKQGLPRHPNLTIKVTFDDELTGRRFVAQRQIHVELQPTTQPGPSPTPVAG
jgi:hypothetical protein